MSRLNANEITELGLYIEYLGTTREQHLILIQKITDSNIVMQDYGNENCMSYKINCLNYYTYEFIGPLEPCDSVLNTYPEYLL